MKFWEDWEGFAELVEYFFLYESIFRIAGATLIILLVLALRQLFVKVIIKMVRKVTSQTRTNFDDQLITALEKPARLALLALGIYFATLVLNLPSRAYEFTSHVTNSLFIFSIFWALYRASDCLSYLLQKLTNKTETNLDDMLVSFLHKSINIIIIIIGTVTLVQEWYKNIAGLLTGLGLGGLAFALAAKDTAANLFGSITIMMDRPFALGDWIKTPHVEGTIEEIGFRSTKVRTFAQALVTIPNSVMSNDPITNWSRMGKRRLTFRLGLTYSTTAEQMEECVKRLRHMLENHPDVHPQTIFVYFERFGDSSLDILLYLFTQTTNWQEFLSVQEDINLKIMGIIEEMGLSVAFPSRSIYIEQSGKKEIILHKAD